MAAVRLVSENVSALELAGGRALVGRDAKQCDYVIDHASVSRRHAVLDERENGWYVVDQKSSNGTFLDGVRVTEAVLHNGQELRFGCVAFQLEAESPSPLSPASGFDKTILMPAIAAAARPPAPAASRPLAAHQASAPAARPAAIAEVAVPRPPSVLFGSHDAPGRLVLSDNGGAPPRRSSGGPRNAAACASEKPAPAPSRRRSESAATADLPALQPSMALGALGSSRLKPAQSAPKAPAPDDVPSGPSPITLGLAAIAVMFVVITAYFWLSMSKLATSLARLEASSELATLRADARRFADTDQLVKSGALVNGTLRLCNLSPFPLEVAWLGAVYMEGDPPISAAEAGPREYRVTSFNSRSCDLNFQMILPPGSEVTPQFEGCPGDERPFDGRALVYALSVRRPDAPDPVWLSGLVGSGQECIKIGEGWTAKPSPDTTTPSPDAEAASLDVR